MIVYPAIDIRGGRAVQLVEGDFSRETQFDQDPVDAALRWEALGAEWIHVVDLDGARSGTRTNMEAIRRIREAVSIPLQLGGGLRTLEDIDTIIGMGIDRAVIGSAAVTEPGLVANAVAGHGEAIAVGLDARNGRLATHGWQAQTDIGALEAATRFSSAGVRHLVFTDIGRDGNLAGPNVESLTTMIEAVDANVIASGGISSLTDIRLVRDAGAAGVIIGTALYTSVVSLPDAIALAPGGTP